MVLSIFPNSLCSTKLYVILFRLTFLFPFLSITSSIRPKHYIFFALYFPFLTWHLIFSFSFLPHKTLLHPPSLNSCSLPVYYLPYTSNIFFCRLHFPLYHWHLAFSPLLPLCSTKLYFILLILTFLVPFPGVSSLPPSARHTTACSISPRL